MAKKSSPPRSGSRPTTPSSSRSPSRTPAKRPAVPSSPNTNAPSAEPRFWLVKTEPESFSIQDLARSRNQTTCWDGVRNYQARNFLRDQMKLGHRVLIYHSNAEPPAAVGVATVVREGYPDHSAWDPGSKYHDPDSSEDEPRWFMVDLRLERIFERPLALDELRKMPELTGMELLRRGSRLSVQPVAPAEFAAIVAAAEKKD